MEVGVEHEATGHDQEVEQQHSSGNLHIPKPVHAKPRLAIAPLLLTLKDQDTTEPQL